MNLYSTWSAAAVLSLWSLAAGPAAIADTLPGAGKSVIPAAESNNPEELFQTFIVGMGLRDLGYDVKDPAVAQIQAAFLSVAAGDTTYYSAFWDPLHASFRDKVGLDKTTLVGQLVGASIQGYLIDKKTADAYHIKNLEQLKDPAVAKLFDTEGTGKATLYGCDPGWGCERDIEHHLDAYGLRDTITHKQGSYFAIITDAIGRIRDGKPTLYYTYTPMWLSSVLVPGRDVTWLTVQKTDLPGLTETNTTVPGIGNLGFSVNVQRVMVNSAFLKANPAAAKWFEEVKIPIEDINSESMKMHEGANKDEDIHSRADAWKAAHQEQWNAWIKAAEVAH